MTQQDYTQHLVTPPDELVSEWARNRGYSCSSELWDYLATQAAQWGADQELEACCEALYSRYVNTGLLPATAATVSQEMRDWLRTTRRPKPPSLKEQALEQLDSISTCFRVTHMGDIVCDKIRRALEALPND